VSFGEGGDTAKLTCASFEVNWGRRLREVTRGHGWLRLAQKEAVRGERPHFQEDECGWISARTHTKGTDLERIQLAQPLFLLFLAGGAFARGRI
jgi:hypothetical protein